MKSSTLMGLIAGALVALGAVVGTLASKSIQAQDANAPLRIAVIDMGAAIKGCKIYDQLNNRAKENLESDWKATIDGLEQELELAEKLFKERVGEETATNRDLEVIRDSVDVLKSRIKLAKEARAASAEAMQFDNTLKTIAAANIVIRKVARQKKYDLVLKYVNLRESREDGSDADNALAAQRAFRQSAQENVILYFAGPKESGRIDDISKQVNDELRAADYEPMSSQIRKEMGIDGEEPKKPAPTEGSGAKEPEKAANPPEGGSGK